MEQLIYIVEDEMDIAELISINMEGAGFKAETFLTISDFRLRIIEKKPALILLDIMLPDGDGMELCKEIKRDETLKSIPVIMVTAKGEEMDRVLGLELGADDYITKPFSVRELTARVKNILKRSDPRAAAESRVLDITEGLKIDIKRHAVTADNENIQLTATEFNILLLLARHKGWVFNRDQILEHLWGDEKAVLDRTVDVHIKHLREKLGDFGKLIQNVRGVGYKLDL